MTDTEKEMENRLCATQAMVLKSFPDAEIAALNLATDYPGYVPVYNLSFKRALEANLIYETGFPCDKESLQRALAYEIGRRVESGTWDKQP